MGIGKKIRLGRGRKGLDQKTLAKRAGIQQSELSRIETEKRDPTVAQLRALAVELGIPARSLL